MDSSTNSLDDVSADSSAEFPDRVSMMEVRLQAQEDEITLLKSSLADALRRIRIHDQLLPLLKQQLIAVNPGASRMLNQVSCSDGCTSSRKLSSSSAVDGIRHPATSQLSESTATNANGHIVSMDHQTKPATLDRSTQTEPTLSVQDAGQDRLTLSRRVQSLHLEDALFPSEPLPEGTRAKLHRVPGMEEEDEEQEEDEEGGGEQEKELAWTSLVEEPIQPTTIRGLQREDFQDGSCSPEEPGSASVSLRTSDQNLSSRSGPLSTIQEGQKPLVRRNSEKLGNPERQRKRLDKKAASSANLLTRSPSLENRAKELVASAGSPGSRRGTYSQGQSIKMFIRGRPITMYVPSNIQNYEDLKMEPPSERLDLDWVYGYRGRDCRANLYFLPTGEAVYFIACVIVLYHINNRTQRHYRKHTDCVRCLTLHPDKVRVASGQTAGVDKDGKPLQPCVHIWDSTTLVTLQQIGLGAFQRGVGSVAFSFDSGAFLCVIDDSNEHMLSVWDCTKGTKHAEIKSTNEAVFAVEFNPSDSTNIITCGKSHVYFWTLNGGQFTKKQGIFGKYKKPKFIQCFVFSLTGDVLTGDSEGNILTWGKSAADVKTLAHEGSVFTLWTLHGGGLLSGGGKDRKIIRWSADLAPERECEIPEKYGAVRTIADVDEEELLVGTTRNAILRGTFSDGFVAIVQGHVDEMWGLATHPSQNIFFTCGHDRQVCLWNTEEHKLDWCITLEEYGLCADFCPSGSVVSVGLSTGRWMVLDLLTREVVSESTDGNEQLSVMRYSPDGSFLAVGSHDNFIYIYNVTESGRRYIRFGKCNGHSSFITHLDWSKDGKYIITVQKWASYTCVLGFHVMGVWLEGSDGTDINALCRSHDERMVAVADDFCKVHLFQYPCPKPKAPSHKYEGHGSHVTNVCFTHSDSHLLSMGGKDTCILQWKVFGAGDSRERLASASVSSTSTSSPEPVTS
uniref:HELP domain-containing protein n=1 Tax=Amphiprion ocellaris TaxID=80972 RepID=A0AAQ5YVY7_AMPOC